MAVRVEDLDALYAEPERIEWPKVRAPVRVQDLDALYGAAKPAPADEEGRFRSWYGEWAQKTGLAPDPDDPLHQYDYRAAFRAGAAPEVDPADQKYHWPSAFKSEGHPNRFVGGIDTITGRPAPSSSPTGRPVLSDLSILADVGDEAVTPAPPGHLRSSAEILRPPRVRGEPQIRAAQPFNPPRLLERFRTAVGLETPESRRLEQAGPAVAEVVAAERGETLPEFREAMVGRQRPLERAAKGVQRGMLGTAESMAGGVEWLERLTGLRTGAGDLAGEVSEVMGEKVRGLQPSDPGFADKLAEGVGSMATFLIPGIGTEVAAIRIAQIAPKLGRWVGAGAAAINEAFAEAGDSYKTMVARGANPNDAAREAGKVFGQNVVLVGVTNKAGLFSEAGGAVTRTLKTSALEGAQEGAQYDIQRRAMGDPFELRQAGEAAAVGAIVGGAAGAGLSALERRRLPGRETQPELRGTQPELRGTQPEVAPPTPEAPPSPSRAIMQEPMQPPALAPPPGIPPAVQRIQDAMRRTEETVGRIEELARTAAEPPPLVTVADLDALQEEVPTTEPHARVEMGQSRITPPEETPSRYGEPVAEVAPTPAQVEPPPLSRPAPREGEIVLPVGTEGRPIAPGPVVDVPRPLPARKPVTPQVPTEGQGYVLPGFVTEPHKRIEAAAAAAAELPPAEAVRAMDQEVEAIRTGPDNAPTVPVPDPVSMRSMIDGSRIEVRYSDGTATVWRKVSSHSGDAWESLLGNKGSGRVESGARLVRVWQRQADPRTPGRRVTGLVSSGPGEREPAPRQLPGRPETIPAPTETTLATPEAPAGETPEYVPPEEVREERMLVTPELRDDAIRRGVSHYEGAADRWEKLHREGATDEHIAAMLAYELGTQGGSHSPGKLGVSYWGGKNPRIQIQPGEVKLGQGEMIRGKRLIAEVRRVFNIPQPGMAGAEAPATPITVEALEQAQAEVAPPEEIGSTIEPVEGGTRGLPAREPRTPDQGPLAEVPPGDVRPAPARGEARGERLPGPGVDDRDVVRPDAQGEAPLRPGVGAGEGGVGVPAERAGRAEPELQPGEPERADQEPVPDESDGERTARQERERKPRLVGGADYRITDADALGKGSAREKAHGNLDAIRLLKAIEQAGRLATPEEQAVLVKYVGWGGIPQPFMPEWQVPREWKTIREALDGTLTPDEFASARASTPNAHYTSAPVIQAMWKAMERLGLDQGQILEPSMGVGHFFGLMPPLDGPIRRTGVELDSITGRIAKLLYPNTNVQVAGFETTRFPNNFFDAAISNVPFGNYGISDPAYRKTPFVLRSIHDYFFAKALDKVRPGGVVAFITSAYTMDKSDPAMRKYLAERADLLGAIRLPNTAFKSTAGTEVTTDILFLQKRKPQTEAKGEKWESLQEFTGKDNKPVTINEYYVRHPEMMLGQMSREGTMYRADEQALVGDLTKEALEAAVARLPADVITAREEPPPAARVSPYDVQDVQTLKDGAYGLAKDGKLVIRQGDEIMAASVPDTAAPRIKGMIEVRNAAYETLRTQIDDESEASVVKARTALNKTYDQFVRRHGPLNSKDNTKAFAGDPGAPLLLALEHYDPETGKATKTEMFTKRTVARYEPPTTADSAAAALTISMAERGRVDWTRMQELTGKTATELQSDLGSLVYRNPEGLQWESAEEYLSGEVREKLKVAEEVAKSDPAYQRNVEALKQVQPEDLPPGGENGIDARLGAGWIPSSDIEAFGKEVLGVRLNVRHASAIAAWTVKPQNRWSLDDVANIETWGTRRYYGHELLTDSLNLRVPTVYDKTEDGSVVNQEETLAAREKQQNLKDKFREWVWQDGDRAIRLARKYNDEYNGIRLRTYDGTHLTFPGSNPAITLQKHQKDAVWRMLQSGNTLLAHVVGAGKTFEMIAGAMEGKRMGLIKKPLFVVPNHMRPQCSNDFLRLYPGANIIVASDEDLSLKGRQRFMAKIASGTFDGIVITHQQFGMLPVTEETYLRFFREQMEELEAARLELVAEKAGAEIVKEIEKAKKRLADQIARRLKKYKKDTTLTFEELGIDWMAVDEAHLFKNLMFSTKMLRMASLPTSSSDRAMDMFMKVRWLSEMTNHRGIVFATGTPISNSMAEAYTMQRYLQLPMLKAKGLGAFDSWAANFGEPITAWETTATGGGYKPKTRFARFVNLPELMSMFRLFADVQTADMLKLPTPKLKRTAMVAQGPPSLRALIQSLESRAKNLGPPVKGGDNMLKITTDGKKGALDMRLVRESEQDHPESKINKAVPEIHRIWESTKKDRLTQIVFIDLSTPKKRGKGQEGFSAYEEIKAKLVRSGIPASEIAFIHDPKNPAAKQQLFDSVNAGRVRILMGTTPKMGVGTNVQRKLIALHHIDAPWKPAEIEQREGRILRQGNSNEEITIYRYVTEGSFDTYMWQTLETKAKFIAQMMRGDLSVRSAEDIDGAALTFAEMKALSSGNPMIAEKVKVDAEVRKYDSLRAHHQHAIIRNKMEIAQLPSKIEVQKKYQEMIQADMAQRDQAKAASPEFAMTVSGTAYSGKGAREEAGKALWKAIQERMGNAGPPVSVGEYLGFELRVQGFETKTIIPTLYVVGQARYTTSINDQNPAGTIQSIESRLRFLDGAEAEARGLVKELEKKLTDFKKAVEEPFDHEAKLKSLTERQKQLQDALDLTKNDQQAATADETDAGDPEAPGGDFEEEVEDEIAEEAEGRPAPMRGRKPKIGGGSDHELPDRADEATRENLRSMRETRAKEEQAGRSTVGTLAGPLGRLFGRGAPPEQPPAGAAPEEPAPPGGEGEGSSVERALNSTAAKGMPGLGERLVEAYHRAREAFTYEYNLRDFPLEQDELRVFHAERRKSLQKAGEDVVGVVGRLADKGELDHFRYIVLLRDYRSRAQDPERFPGGIPGGLTGDQVEAELTRLEDSAPQRVREALEAHQRLMDAEREDLENRDLLDPERAIPDYFPHKVLDFEGQAGETPGTGRRLRQPGRGFLRRAQGSTRDVETDYIRAMFRHRSEVRYANAVDDFSLKILNRHDKADTLEPEVRRALRPGQIVEVNDEPHKAIQYRPGRHIFGVHSVPEQALADAIEAGQSTLELNLEDLRSRGALGRYFRMYVVPQPIAERFENFTSEKAGPMLKFLNDATSRWKGITVGFWGQAGNLMNLMGDLMNLSRTPGALAQLPGAVKDVWQWKHGNGSDLVRLMEKYDVLDSGYVANETYFRARAPELRQFISKTEAAKQMALDRVKGALAGGVLGAAAGGPVGAVAGASIGGIIGARLYFRGLPEAREAIPRAAAARYQMRRLRRGLPLRPGPTSIEGLSGERAAMKIAREQMVDYGKFTPDENRLVRGLLMPFYAFTKQNTPNWVRFLWASKIGLLSFLGLRLLLEMWNNSDDERRAVEQSLLPYKRNQAHIVTGFKDEQGKNIVIYWAGDPMADALGTVGLGGTPGRISDLMTERITLGQAAEQQMGAFLKEPGMKAVGLLTPAAKVGSELATGKSALTGQDIVPRGLEGTSESYWRQGRHAAESLFRPLREERKLREQAGTKEGFDPLSHRFGLGLPFERVDPQRARERVSMQKWYEAMSQHVEQRLDQLRGNPAFGKLAPHQQEIVLTETARKARGEFSRAMPAPVPRKERLRQRMER